MKEAKGIFELMETPDKEYDSLSLSEKLGCFGLHGKERDIYMARVKLRNHLKQATENGRAKPKTK